MSFSHFQKKDYSPNQEEVKLVTSQGLEVVFVAKEVSFLQRLQVDLLQQKGGDHGALLISLSVHDAEGNRPTVEQVSGLSDEAQLALFLAAARANGLVPSSDGADESEKN